MQCVLATKMAYERRAFFKIRLKNSLPNNIYHLLLILGSSMYVFPTSSRFMFVTHNIITEYTLQDYYQGTYRTS